MIVEICVETVDGALAAQRGGADRVELCANLLEGGTTPSFAAIHLARQHVGIPIHVLIRPRGGDFLWSDLEMAVMHEDIHECKRAGVTGVVMGCLTPAGDIDIDRMRILLSAAQGMNVTFHRAFDLCRDPFAALDQLIELGIPRLLTSGQAPTALEGAELIAKLRQRAGDRITIMAGGGITPENVRQIVDQTGVSEVHLSARSTLESAMRFRNARCRMGGTPLPSEFQRRITDEAIIRNVLRALG